MPAPRRRPAKPATSTRASIVESGRVELDRHVSAITEEQVRVWAAAWQHTRDELVAAARAAAAQATALGRPDVPAAYRTARLERSLGVLAGQLRELGKREGVRIGSLVGPAVSIPVEVQRQLAGAAGIVWNMPPERALQNIVQRTAQKIASDYLVLSRDAEEQLRQSLVRAVASGQGARQAASELVRRTADARTAQLLATGLGNAASADVGEAIAREAQTAFAGGLRRANNLVRTELLDASRMATRDSYVANQGLVHGWRWLATLDSRTCAACWGMHNTVHKADEQLEGHQQCRCAPVPILAGDDELDPATGRTLDDLGHPDDTFRKLSRQSQLEVLGPSRLKAWESGVPLRAMAQRQERAGWRPAHYVTPVRDLPAGGLGHHAPTRPPVPAAPPPVHLVDPPAPHALEGISLGGLHDDDVVALMGDADVIADDRALAYVIAELERRDAAAAAALEAAAEPAALEAVTGPLDDAAELAAWSDAWGAADVRVSELGGRLPPKRVKASAEQQTREAFELWLEATMEEALEATAGNLTSRAGKRAGVSQRQLWEGSADASVRYASEELRRWWAADPRRRITYTEFRAPTSRRGKSSRQAFLDALTSTDVQTGRRRR